MSIAKRVNAAMTALTNGDAEQAFHDICSAIEPTAAAEYGRGGRSNYKAFIKDNLALITRMSGLSSIANLRLAYDHSDLQPDHDGLVGIEDVIYHVVRCGLYHQGEIPTTLRFENSTGIQADGGSTLVLPASLVQGLIIAVVVSPANAGQKSPPTHGIQVDFINVNLNALWGKRAQLKELLDAIDSVRTAIRAIERK